MREMCAHSDLSGRVGQGARPGGEKKYTDGRGPAGLGKGSSHEAPYK